MMGGENKQTQTNTNKATGTQSTAATPYSAAKPLYDKGLSSALNNFNAVNSGQDWNRFTNEGAGDLARDARTAIAADPVRGAMNNWQSTFGNDGYNAAQRDSMSYLEPTARGDYVNLENPDFQRLLNKSMEDAATEASMVASGMGRSGSDFHQGAVAERVGDVAANARLGQYNLERDRQNAAISQLFGMGQTGMGNTAAAGDVYGSLYDARSRPGTDLMALGQMGNTNVQNLLGAAQFANPFATVKGTNTSSGSGTGTTAQPNNTFGQIAGATLGGLSLFG